MLRLLKYTVLFAFLHACNTNDTHLSITISQTKLENGVLFYNDQPFIGLLQSFYPDKALKSEIQYSKGKKHGYEKHWYRDGSKSEERFYNEGMKSGVHKSWWPKGNLKFEYHFNTTGAYHGSVKEWYKNGQIFKAFNYNQGKEVGKQRLWKINGNIRANYEVINGERFGLIGLKKCYTVTEDSNTIK